MPRPLRVLMVEDSDDDALLMVQELKRAGYSVVSQRVESAERMAGALAAAPWDVVLCDYTVPHFSVEGALEVLREAKLDLPFIVVSGTVTEAMAVAAMKAGAHDYVMKGNLARLAPAIEREVKDAHERAVRRAAQEALRESEERFFRLAENAPDIIFRLKVGDKVKYEYISPAALAVTGYGPKEFYGDQVTGEMSGEALARAVSALDADLSWGQPLVMKWRHKDGRPIWVEMRAVPVRGEGSKLVAVEGIVRAVTERVEAEARLAHLASFPELDPHVVIELDSGGNLAYVNPAAREAFPDLESLGTAHPFLAGWRGVAEQARSSARSFITRELRLGDAWYKQTVVYVQPTQRCRVYAEEITERKRADEALRESEALHKSIMSVVDVGVAQFDLTGRRTYVNDAIVRWYGVPAEELLKGHVGDHLSPEEREKAERNNRLCIETRKPLVALMGTYIKDGKVRYTRTSLHPLFAADGSVREVQATSIDVTELVEAQEKLRESEKLYRDIVELADVGIARVDAQGRRVFVNEVLCARLKRSKEELLNGVIFDGNLPEDRERGMSALALCINTGARAAGLMQRWVVDGKVRYTRGNLTPLFDAQGRVTGAQMMTLDVTDLMEAQERLQESEALYRDVAAVGDVAVSRFDLEGRRTFVNEALIARTGMSREQLLEGTLGDRNLPEDRARSQALFRKCIQTGRPITGIIDRFVKDGRLHYVRENMSPLLDREGQVKGVQLTSIDITEEMEAQEELRRTSEFYQNLMDGADVGVVVLDLEGRRTYVNDRAARAQGQPPEALLGKPFADRVLEADRGWLWATFRRVRDTGTPAKGLVYPVALPDGSARWRNTTFSPVRDAAGAVTGVQLTWLDVTEQMEALEKVRQSEALYHSLIDAIGGSIIRVNREGKRLFVSQSSRDASDRSSEEMMKGRFGDTMVPEDREKAWTLLREVFETGRPVRGFVTRQLIGGEVRHISADWQPILDAEGKVAQVQTISVDITAQKRLEEQFYQAQKMEGIGRLAGGVAHDINNMLTPIMGYADLLRHKLPEGSRLRDYAQEILDAGERSASLVRQLLAFSRRNAVEPRVVDLNELVTNLDKLLHRLIGEDIRLSTMLQPGLWPTKVDPGLLEQVVINLVVNSRDAMPEGGMLTVRTANLSSRDATGALEGLPDGDYVALSVIDTGVGMSEEVQSHLFEPFFTTKPRGTGLGLATCYGVVKQAGGDIRVDSRPGHGATMTVLLPRATDVTATVQPKRGEPPAEGGRETVLLAEDERSVRELAAAVLREKGYQVLLAEDGAAALRLLQEHPDQKVDLLLTDVVMPNMGGSELAARLKEAAPGLKVLFMSGYTDERVSGHGLGAPGVQFIGKPFAPSQLARKVREVLDAGALGDSLPGSASARAARGQQEASWAAAPRGRRRLRGEKDDKSGEGRPDSGGGR